MSNTGKIINETALKRNLKQMLGGQGHKREGHKVANEN